MKNIKKLALFFAVGLILFAPLSGLLPLLTGSASAAPSDDAGITGRVDAYIAIGAVAECMEKAELSDSGEFLQYANRIDDNDAVDFKWYRDNPIESTDHVMHPGYLDDDDQNGDRECSDASFLGELYGILGWSDAIEAICKSGFVRTSGDTDQSAEECMNGGGEFERPGDGGDTVARFLKNVNKEFYGRDSSSAPTLSAAETYYYNFNSLVVLCGAQETSDKSDAQIRASDYLYKIHGDDGKVHVYESSAKKSDTFSTRDKISGTSVDDVNKSCQQMADDADDNWEAYQEYLKEHPEENPQIDGGEFNDSGTSPDIECVEGGKIAGVPTNPIDWLTCGIINGLRSAANGLENIIVGMLCINESDIFTSSMTCSDSEGTQSSRDSFYSAWNVFRVLALAFILIGGLIMIISQGLGFDFIDAYTIKKVLPRMLAAGIIISLSWPLLQFLVTLSNAFGIGIRGLIYAPFSSIQTNSDILSGGDVAITALFAGGAFAALGALGILSFIATALLALLIAFFVLVIRNILVIFLVIFAPLAIAFYVLPNTEKYAKLWWDWLFKALMLFPIVTAMIAVGHVFAAITLQKDGALSTFVAFAAYFAPYFLIPAAFRFAGGALATIGGFANDRSRGMFDTLSNFRKNRSQENLSAIKRGFDQTKLGSNLKAGRQRQIANRSAWGSGNIGVGKFGTQGYKSGIETSHFGHLAHEAAESIKNNPSAAANDDANKIARSSTSRNDFLNRYQSEIGGTREDAMNQLASLEQAYGTSMGSTQMQHTAATAALASNASTDSVGERAQWMRDAVSSHVMNQAQAAALVKQSGSLASSASFGDLMAATSGTSPMSDAELLKRATKGFNPANSHRMRTGQAEELAKEVFRQVDEAGSKHGVGSDEFARAVADAAGHHDMMNGMTPDVREAFAKQLNGQAVGGKYVREHESIMEATGNGAFLDRRKTWGGSAVGASGGSPGGGGTPPGGSGGGAPGPGAGGGGP